MRRHNKEKLFECCVCNASFCDQTSHRRHLLRHLPLSLLQCPLCPFHTSAPLHFTKHFSSRHKLQSQLELCFECKLCGEKSIDLKSYCAHSRSHHSDLLQQLVAQHQPTEAPG
ncbi:zinc finger protein 136 [Hyalella azteca]|uniref:Zinc finger protein 136 n=1 Tax=Hyalella azteca TaxID=294128 RepID=A0A8B7N5I7_HYAAZ|nr:zinc finger protein 136 [Hyalella azteca]